LQKKARIFLEAGLFYPPTPFLPFPHISVDKLWKSCGEV
jgi:hypothetical protein